MFINPLTPIIRAANTEEERNITWDIAEHEISLKLLKLMAHQYKEEYEMKKDGSVLNFCSIQEFLRWKN